MSHEVKRWVGNLTIAVVLVAVGSAGWWFVSGGGDEGADAGRAGNTSAVPVPSPGTTPAPSPSPEGSSSYVNAGPDEHPPVRPPDELSDAGLEAFVRYFAQTADWAIASMDPTLLAAVSSSTCGGCTSMISGIQKDIAAGHRIEGSRSTVTLVMAFPNVGGDETSREAGVWWDTTAYTVYAQDGSIIEQAAAESDIEYSVGAQFRNGRWSVVSLRLVKRAG